MFPDDIMNLFAGGGAGPQADPFALGNLFRTNPDAAAGALAANGVPPPAPGQSFMDHIKGAFGNLAGAPSPLFAGQPGTPPAPASGTPSHAGDVASLFGGMENPQGGAVFGNLGAAPPPAPTGAPPPGLPGAGQSGTMTRSTVPDILAPTQNTRATVPDVLAPTQNAPQPFTEADRTGPNPEQGGPKAQESPKITGSQLGQSLKNSLAALKAPAGMEPPIKAGAPGIPHVAPLPKDQVAQILQALVNPRVKQLMLGQSLGG